MNTSMTATHPVTMPGAPAAAAPRRRWPAPAFTHRVPSGTAVHLGDRRGELTVVRGPAWVTFRDDPRDHIVEAGQRLHLPKGHEAVVEPVHRGDAVLLNWRPDS